MTPTQPDQEGILRQALGLPDEQKARLLEEMLQHELGSSAENNRPFSGETGRSADEIGSKNAARIDGGGKLGQQKKFLLSTASRSGAGDGVAALT
jgi:hypothetical protein